MTEIYDPEMCVEAENLFKQRKLSEALELALKARDLAIDEARQRWSAALNETSALAKLTKSWDSTTQQYVDYETYLKVHNWEDDIAPAPSRIVAKILRFMGREAYRNGEFSKALECYEKIIAIGEATDNDLKQLDKLTQKTNS